MIHSSITYQNVFDYIEHSFIARNKKEKLFLQSLQANMQKMRAVDTNVPILSGYHKIRKSYRWKIRQIKNIYFDVPFSKLFKRNRLRTMILSLNERHPAVGSKELCNYQQFQQKLDSPINANV